MTVYVQYHWDYNNDEEGTMVDIVTTWTDGQTSTASPNNNYLVGHSWIDGLGFTISTPNIRVTSFEQTFNSMDVFIRYDEIE